MSQIDLAPLSLRQVHPREMHHTPGLMPGQISSRAAEEPRSSVSANLLDGFEQFMVLGHIRRGRFPTIPGVY